MKAEKFELSPPTLRELTAALKAPLAANFEHSNVEVVQCPDLRRAPFHLAMQGLSGNEKAADVGGQPNLFPTPIKESIWSLTDIAKAMEMSPEKGSLLGAGAGPFHQVGQNCELTPNISWQQSFENVHNGSYVAKIDPEVMDVRVIPSPSLNCALMINLFGSAGEPGEVIKVTARKRIGKQNSFTECIRRALHARYGDTQTISLGGVFLVRSGKIHYHIMPDFPADLPFKNFTHLNDWLEYRDFSIPTVCCSVLHSADPDKKMALRMEHTHCFSPNGQHAGGHYHFDVDPEGEIVEYEGYFTTAKVIYRLGRPAVTLEGDLHDELHQ
ncbi:hypothetical protein LTR84_012006 [Exophiala bonariae]|uniref:DUF1907 domain-containing protein n=1 Tax=Exophiala bonariae TaxID=1690606 RepID=A0AAV9MRC4_9EURO|nr:hypothetical protein LTR84_012006 [Exophiala bonariae]